VEHDGVVYHVQTEDKGLETPLVLSLVYAGGAILASKRSSYRDLLAAGFDEAVLIERLQRQHRLICAAINAGRIEDLKKMGAPSRQQTPEAVLPPPAATVEPPSPPEQGAFAGPVEPVGVGHPASVETSRAVPKSLSAYTVYDSRRRAPQGVSGMEAGLRIKLEGEKDYRGGDAVDLRITVIRVTHEGEGPVAATLSVKILGTTFRPVILTLKTDNRGSVACSTRIPNFKSGRAAIVIKATAADLSNETRRVIYPG